MREIQKQEIGNCRSERENGGENGEGVYIGGEGLESSQDFSTRFLSLALSSVACKSS
jgi:hypothetical protein